MVLAPPTAAASLAVSLSVQLPDNVPKKVAEEGPALGPPHPYGRTGEAPGSWLQSGTTMATETFGRWASGANGISLLLSPCPPPLCNSVLQIN